MLTKWVDSEGKPESYEGDGVFETGKGAIRLNNTIIAVVRSGDIVEIYEDRILVNQSLIWERK